MENQGVSRGWHTFDSIASIDHKRDDVASATQYPRLRSNVLFWAGLRCCGNASPECHLAAVSPKNHLELALLLPGNNMGGRERTLILN